MSHISEKELLDPAVLTKQNQDLWHTRGRKIGLDLLVAPCPYSHEELASFKARGMSISYLPPELSTQQSRHLLGSIFPDMKCYSLLPDNLVENDNVGSGWFDYESSIDSPNNSTTGSILAARLMDTGRVLLTLNQYIVASQDSRNFTGQFLDENGSWSRVAAHIGGRHVAVRIDGARGTTGRLDELPVLGSLLTAWDCDEDDHGPGIGGRSTTQPSLDGSEEHTRSSTYQHLEVPPIAVADQIETLISLGIHRELGVDECSYRSSILSEFNLDYREPDSIWNLPVLVDPRIPWPRLAELAGTQTSVFLDQCVEDAIEFTGSDHSPRSQPYVAWFAGWGERFTMPLPPDQAREELDENEVGANLNEALYFNTTYPQFVANGRFFDLLGTVIPPRSMGASVQANGPVVARTASLYFWRGQSEVGSNLRPHAFDIFRPLVYRSFDSHVLP